MLNFTRIFSRRMTSVCNFPSTITFFPSTITFFVKVISTVPMFSYKLVDTLLGYDLWKVAEDKTPTDVELLVGNSAFSARRALLSAKCQESCVCSMLKSGMKEARTGRVLFSVVDPATFTHFLRFKYEREKGSCLLSPTVTRWKPSRSVDVEEMMDAFFSCQ